MAKKGEVNRNIIIPRAEVNMRTILDACRALGVDSLLFGMVYVDLALFIRLDDYRDHIYGDVVVGYVDGEPLYKADALRFIRSKCGTRNVMIKFGQRTIKGRIKPCGVVHSKGVRVPKG